MTNERILREWQVFLGERLGCRFDEAGHTHCDRGEECPHKNKCVEDSLMEAWRRRMEEIDEADHKFLHNPGICEEWKTTIRNADKFLDHVWLHGECARTQLPTTEQLHTRLAELVGLVYSEVHIHSKEELEKKYHMVGFEQEELYEALATLLLADTYPGWWCDNSEHLCTLGNNLGDVLRKISIVK